MLAVSPFRFSQVSLPPLPPSCFTLAAHPTHSTSEKLPSQRWNWSLPPTEAWSHSVRGRPSICSVDEVGLDVHFQRVFKLTAVSCPCTSCSPAPALTVANRQFPPNIRERWLIPEAGKQRPPLARSGTDGEGSGCPHPQTISRMHIRYQSKVWTHHFLFWLMSFLSFSWLFTIVVCQDNYEWTHWCL